MQQNAMLVVDDDKDDTELIRDAVNRLNISRPFQYFDGGAKLEEFILTSEVAPFLILCDLNLPNETGFTIRKRIAENTRIKYKSITFIFWSTDASEKQIQQAYDLPAQGFFFKPAKFQDLCDTLDTILRYWQMSKHPKRVV